MFKEKTGFPSIDKTHLEGISTEELSPKIYPYSMYKTFLKMNEGYMDETVIYDGNGEHWKKELAYVIETLVQAFLARGVEPGVSTVTMATPNSFEMVAEVMAANAIGLKVFFLDYLNDEKDLLKQSLELGARFLFLGDVVWELSHEECKEFSLGDFFETSENCADDYKEVMRQFEEYGEPTIFLQTSGSTSVPKVLPFTNSAIYATMIFALNSTRIENHDPVNRKLMTILSARLPFGFMTGFVPVLWGQEVVFASGATPKDIAQYYKYGAFLIFGTPVLLQAMMKLTPPDADLSPLKKFYSSGLSTPEELFPAAEAFFKAHNSTAKVCNNYGFGEGLGVGTASDTVIHKPGTSGKFYIGPKWVIVDEDMNEMKYGEAGELIVSSPTLCQGYLNNPEATAEAFVNFRNETYFKIGDYVSVDEEGYVTYLGRKKRFFQPLGAGDKVSCEMIEKVLYELEFVERAAVVPVTNSENVTIGKAFVVIKTSSNISEDEATNIISAHFNERLKRFQIPEALVILDEIPLMASGKIDYRLLSTM